MICPLKGGEYVNKECVKGKCTWWSPDGCCCVVWRIHAYLQRLAHPISEDGRGRCSVPEEHSWSDEDDQGKKTCVFCKETR